MNKKIIICAGGTGGHVFPAVNFGNFMIDKGFDCILILDSRGKKYSSQFKGKIYEISSHHLGGNIFFKIKSIIFLLKGLIQSLIIITKFSANNCICFGSYATLMPLFVLIILKNFKNINLYIHEQNSVIGKVNLFVLPFVKNLFTNFEVLRNLNKKYIHKHIHVGMPLNNSNLKLEFDFDILKEKKIIFVYGGSQGSVPLISNFLLILKNINNKYLNNIQLFIQSQKNMHINISKELNKLEVDFVIREFYQNIDELLSFSHIAITRAGAGTINDLINNKIPSIIMPLPNAIYNHQYYNAKFLSDNNAAILLEEKNFKVDISSKIFLELIYNQDKRNLMINELRKINLPDANKIILSEIKNVN